MTRDDTVSDERIAEIREGLENAARFGADLDDMGTVAYRSARDLLRALDQLTAERDAAVATERAAVVAYLEQRAVQSLAWRDDYGHGMSGAYGIASARIRAGEHVK
jgi:hypothetical protein